ncbi:MAG: hypothetical protein MUD10_01005 [Candidatus Pacebacteria bacterium]|jgi:hypothetical protein|nr:hypothetical protein [Candidatus Paceibacterota bacterium]
MNSIIRFVRYNNAVPVAISLAVFLAAGAFAASPEIREGLKDGMISEKETIRSADNSRLLAVDIADFDFKLKISNITEDDLNYYIDYYFNTFMLQDHVWQIGAKTEVLKIEKSVLAGRDLGVYVAEELKELIDYERSYLADTQSLEKEKGITQKTATITYSGLIGKFLDPEEKVFSGYQQVVPDIVKSEPVQAANIGNVAVEGGQVRNNNQIDEGRVREIVEQMLANKLAPQADEATVSTENNSAGFAAPAPAGQADSGLVSAAEPSTIAGASTSTIAAEPQQDETAPTPVLPVENPGLADPANNSPQPAEPAAAEPGQPISDPPATAPVGDAGVQMVSPELPASLEN